MEFEFFFKGKLPREEVSSAFLATALQWHTEFRAAFFRSLPAGCFEEGDLERCLSARWTVRVEDDLVDITLESSDHDQVFLIENKVRLGSRQVGQLLRYYDDRTKREPSRRIVAIYLAPHGAAGGEVDRVRPHLRDRDHAEIVSWHDVLDLGEVVSASDPFRPLITSGLSSIGDEIRKGEEERYPLQGDRLELWNLIGRVRDQLRDTLMQRNQHVSLLLWRGRDFHQIYTSKTPISLTVDVVFDAEAEPPHIPVGVVDGGKLKVTLRTAFKLAGSGRRVPELRDWWSALKAEKAIEVGGNRFEMGLKEWFIHQTPVVGFSDALVETFVATADKMFTGLANKLTVPS